MPVPVQKQIKQSTGICCRLCLEENAFIPDHSSLDNVLQPVVDTGKMVLRSTGNLQQVKVYGEACDNKT